MLRNHLCLYSQFLLVIVNTTIFWLCAVQENSKMESCTVSKSCHENTSISGWPNKKIFSKHEDRRIRACLHGWMQTDVSSSLALQANWVQARSHEDTFMQSWA